MMEISHSRYYLQSKIKLENELGVIVTLTEVTYVVNKNLSKINNQKWGNF